MSIVVKMIRMIRVIDVAFATKGKEVDSMSIGCTDDCNGDPLKNDRVHPNAKKRTIWSGIIRINPYITVSSKSTCSEFSMIKLRA